MPESVCEVVFRQLLSEGVLNEWNKTIDRRLEARGDDRSLEQVVLGRAGAELAASPLLEGLPLYQRLKPRVMSDIEALISAHVSEVVTQLTLEVSTPLRNLAVSLIKDPDAPPPKFVNTVNLSRSSDNTHDDLLSSAKKQKCSPSVSSNLPTSPSHSPVSKQSPTRVPPSEVSVLPPAAALSVGPERDPSDEMEEGEIEENDPS